MADPFSVATGALAVATAGIKVLADTLTTYINCVRKAEKQPQPIVDHVKLTSNVLANVGTPLKDEQVRQLYTAELLNSTSEALKGLQKSFEDLDDFVTRILKRGQDGRFSMSLASKLNFHFKQKELDFLQAHMERFKSSLDLMLGVYNLANAAR